MDAEELFTRHPRVFHTMPACAWAPVQQHGLLSTVRLIDLFGLDAADRDELLSAPRACSRPAPPASRRPTGHRL
jgi:hypothetical protein